MYNWQPGPGSQKDPAGARSMYVGSGGEKKLPVQQMHAKQPHRGGGVGLAAGRASSTIGLSGALEISCP